MDPTSILNVVTLGLSNIGNTVTNYVNLWQTSDALSLYEGENGLINNLLNKYENSMNFRIEQQQTSVENENSLLNRNIGWTREDQGRSANIASMLNTANQSLLYSQISEMAAEGEQAVGQARQAVATSGFRSTGSAMNATNEVQRKSDVQIDQAERQLKLTAAQNYVSASENYLSAERKVQEYQDNIETNLLNLELYLQNEEREWKYFQEDVSDLSDYASDLRGAIENEKGWGLTASIFTLGIYQGNSYQSEFAALESRYNYLLQLARRTSL